MANNPDSELHIPQGQGDDICMDGGCVNCDLMTRECVKLNRVTQAGARIGGMCLSAEILDPDNLEQTLQGTMKRLNNGKIFFIPLQSSLPDDI